MVKAVFLDRDGVLNEPIMRDGVLGSPRSLEEFRLLPGIGEQVRRLKAAGYLVIVVTNQPDVARGLLSRADLAAMRARLIYDAGVDFVLACMHDDGQCRCRKPAAGMLLRAARQWNIDLERSWMVGDQWRDRQAGILAGCHTFLLDSGSDLKAAVECILVS